MIPAIQGEWWQSDKGAVYCVDGVGWGDRGQSARVEVWWVTNHERPQVHRLRLYPAQWNRLTTFGRRLDDGPPSHNNKGSSLSEAVARVREMIASSPSPPRPMESP